MSSITLAVNVLLVVANLVIFANTAAHPIRDKAFENRVNTLALRAETAASEAQRHATTAEQAFESRGFCTIERGGMHIKAKSFTLVNQRGDIVGQWAGAGQTSWLTCCSPGGKSQASLTAWPGGARVGAWHSPLSGKELLSVEEVIPKSE